MGTEARVVLVSFSVAQFLHELGGGVAEMQGDRGQGAFVVPQTDLDITVSLVHIHRLGCPGQVDHTLCQDHLRRKEGREPSK